MRKPSGSFNSAGTSTGREVLFAISGLDLMLYSAIGFCSGATVGFGVVAGGAVGEGTGVGAGRENKACESDRISIGFSGLKPRMDSKIRDLSGSGESALNWVRMMV